MTAGGTLVAVVVANALDRNVEPKPGVFGGSSGIGLALAKRLAGGFWVGGTLSLYDDRIEFEPNEFNKFVQVGEMAWRVPLSDIKDVVVRPALVTKIIDITTVHEVKSVRCFNASGFAEKIEAACRARTAER